MQANSSGGSAAAHTKHRSKNSARDRSNPSGTVAVQELLPARNGGRLYGGVAMRGLELAANLPRRGRSRW